MKKKKKALKCSSLDIKYLISIFQNPNYNEFKTKEGFLKCSLYNATCGIPFVALYQ